MLGGPLDEKELERRRRGEWKALQATRPDGKVSMNLYLAGPMRGKPLFNFPTFNRVAEVLREKGHTVFNPAESDNEKHGTDISAGNTSGDEAQAAAQHGFSLREALGRDLAWITSTADGIVLLPGWDKSKGATAEYYTSVALGLKVFYVDEDGNELMGTEKL